MERDGLPLKIVHKVVASHKQNPQLEIAAEFGVYQHMTSSSIELCASSASRMMARVVCPIAYQHLQKIVATTEWALFQN